MWTWLPGHSPKLTGICSAAIWGATAMQGPMCIYNPAHKQLLMIWAASGHEVDWPRMERIWKSDCGPVTLARFWHLIKLQKLRQNLDQELRNRGLPATRPVIVPVPVKDMVTAARCQFAGNLRRSFPPSVVRWCLSQVRFSHGKFPRHRDSWTHIKDTRKLDWNKLHEVAPGSMYDALAGQNMQRIEQSWGCAMLSERRRTTEALSEIYGTSLCTRARVRADRMAMFAEELLAVILPSTGQMLGCLQAAH